MLLLLILILLFLALPTDAQERVAQGVGLLVTRPYAPYVAAGGLGALVVCLVFYNAVWNAAMYRLYLEDVGKAEDTYRKRKR